jgi:hypothetical protein
MDTLFTATMDRNPNFLTTGPEQRSIIINKQDPQTRLMTDLHKYRPFVISYPCAFSSWKSSIWRGRTIQWYLRAFPSRGTATNSISSPRWEALRFSKSYVRKLHISSCPSDIEYIQFYEAHDQHLNLVHKHTKKNFCYYQIRNENNWLSLTHKGCTKISHTPK